MSKMKVIAMKQSAMHRLTRITLEAGVRRLENLQDFLISRKFPPIQITVKMTLMLIKMLRCRSGFRQNMSKELLESSERKVSQCRILHLGMPTTDLFSSNRLNSNKVSFGNVGLFVYISYSIFGFGVNYPIFTPFRAFVLKY